MLDDLGLSAAIEWQAREVERHAGISCQIQSQPDDIVLDQARSTAPSWRRLGDALAASLSEILEKA